MQISLYLDARRSLSWNSPTLFAPRAQSFTRVRSVPQMVNYMRETVTLWKESACRHMQNGSFRSAGNYVMPKERSFARLPRGKYKAMVLRAHHGPTVTLSLLSPGSSTFFPTRVTCRSLETFSYSLSRLTRHRTSSSYMRDGRWRIYPSKWPNYRMFFALSLCLWNMITNESGEF